MSLRITTVAVLVTGCSVGAAGCASDDEVVSEDLAAIDARVPAAPTDAPPREVLPPPRPVPDCAALATRVTDALTSNTTEDSKKKLPVARVASCTDAERAACPVECAFLPGAAEPPPAAAPEPKPPAPDGDVKWPFESSDVDGPTAGLPMLRFKYVDAAFIPKDIPKAEGALAVTYKEGEGDRSSTVWPVVPPAAEFGLLPPGVDQAAVAFGKALSGDQFFRGDDRGRSADEKRSGRVVQDYIGTLVVADGKASAALADAHARCDETVEFIIPKENRKAPPAASTATEVKRATAKPDYKRDLKPLPGGLAPHFYGGEFRNVASAVNPLQAHMPGASMLPVKTTIFGKWIWSAVAVKEQGLGAGLNAVLCSTFAEFPSHDMSLHVGGKSIAIGGFDTTRTHPVFALMTTMDAKQLCHKVFINAAGGAWVMHLDKDGKGTWNGVTFK